MSQWPISLSANRAVARQRGYEEALLQPELPAAEWTFLRFVWVAYTSNLGLSDLTHKTD